MSKKGNFESTPSVWPRRKLGNIAATISPGFPCGDHNQNGDGVPHLRPMNVSPKGEVDLSKTKYVKEDYTALRAGDVLFNNTNSPVWVGKTAHVDRFSGQPGAGGDGARARPDAGCDFSRSLGRQICFGRNGKSGHSTSCSKRSLQLCRLRATSGGEPHHAYRSASRPAARGEGTERTIAGSRREPGGRYCFAGADEELRG